MGQIDVARLIGAGRTDLVFDFLALPKWQDRLSEVLHAFVYYNDVTALRAVLAAGGTLTELNLDAELFNASFFGHWKVCDFLIAQGANPRWADPDTGETALHAALCKAGRPHFADTLRLLLERGADPDACTIAGKATGCFMRDVRTRGETPLHRAAAYGDEAIINLLIKAGADKRLRDANGDTPLSWASWHLRPNTVLALLTFDDHHIGAHRLRFTYDHGVGWGAMESDVLGAYEPLGR